jgi:hypothetical protein
VIGVVSQTLNPISVLVRTGGSLPQNVNFAIKIQNVKAFLDTCGLQKQDYLTEASSRSFDQVQDSVVKIYSGTMTDEEIAQPKMVCNFGFIRLMRRWLCGGEGYEV